jgi:hypothetical protein
MTDAHTPAPWRLDGPRTKHITNEGDDYHVIDAGDNIGPPDGIHIAAFMTLADARLIAASPLLLEATRNAFSIMDSTSTDKDDVAWLVTIAELCAAIRAAEDGE